MIPSGRTSLLSAAPAVGAFCALAAGVWIGRMAPQPSVWIALCLATLCASLACVAPSRWRVVAVSLGAVFVGVSAFRVQVQHTPADGLGFADMEVASRLLRVEGVIVSPIERERRRGRFARYTFQPESTSFVLHVRAVVGDDGARVRASGRLHVRVQGESTSLRTGDAVRVLGEFTPPKGATNPGGASLLLWAQQSNWAGLLRTPGGNNIEQVQDATIPTVRQAVVGAQASLASRAGAWIERAGVDENSEAILAGAFLGRDHEALPDVRRHFERIGVAHILAISGLHLVALSWLALSLLRLLPRGDMWAPLALVALVGLYIWIVPARPSVMRAGVMTMFLLAGEAGGRRLSPIAVLAVAGIAVLLWRPLDLWSAGFQLSFGVVAGLLALTEPLGARLFGVPAVPDDPASLRLRVLRHAQRLLCGAAVAWLAATPLLVYHFGVFNPWAPIAAIVLSPVFALLLGAGQSVTLVSAIAPGAGIAMAPIAGALSDATLWFTSVLDAAPLTIVRLPRVPGALCAAFALLTCWWILVDRSRFALRWCATGVVVAAFAFVFHGAARTAGVGREVALRIDTLDVGDGTCHLIRSGGESLLWDAGSSDLQAGFRELPRAVRALGAWRTPAVVLTHANLDHYSALPDLLGPLGIDRVYVNPYMKRELEESRDGALGELREALAEAEATVVSVSLGDSIKVGDLTIEILSPAENDEFDTVNDTSLVGRIRVPTADGGRVVLLTGDIEDDAIESLLERRPGLCADVLEVPHHGSARNAAIDLVSRVDPAVVLQSTGPSRVRDERWRAAREGRTWCTTAEIGSFAVEILGSGAIRTARTSEFGLATLPDEAEATEVRHGQAPCSPMGRGEVDEEGLAHDQ